MGIHAASKSIAQLQGALWRWWKGFWGHNGFLRGTNEHRLCEDADVADGRVTKQSEEKGTSECKEGEEESDRHRPKFARHLCAARGTFTFLLFPLDGRQKPKDVRDIRRNE